MSYSSRLDDLNYHIEDVTIEVVSNGSLAVDRYKSEVYDAILMDVQMPVMNGFEATAKIRELEQSKQDQKRTPIIAMTASLLKLEIQKCYEAGMDNYIPKPYNVDQLIGALHEEIKEG